MLQKKIFQLTCYFATFLSIPNVQAETMSVEEFQNNLFFRYYVIHKSLL